MKKTLVYTALVVMTAAFAVGCSSYGKLLKSDDAEAQYRAALTYLEEGKYQRTLALLEKVRINFINTPKEDSILYYMGLSFYKMGDFETSSLIFDEFRQGYRRSPFLDEAEYMYAKGFYFLSPEPDRDQTSTRQALMTIDEYLSSNPDSPKREVLEEDMNELMQKLHDKAFINAKTYYKIGRHTSAIYALKEALDTYPQSSHREEILYLIAKASYEYAAQSVPGLRRQRYTDMIDSYLNYISEYPEGEYAGELTKLHENAKKYIARFSDSAQTVEIE